VTSEVNNYVFLGFAALLAGVVDAVIGGGGMVRPPAFIVVVSALIVKTFSDACL